MEEDNKAKKKIDISAYDLEKEKGKISENPGIISFPHRVGSAMIRPEDKGKIKGRAMMAMKEQTGQQSQQLYQQMQILAQQANDIKKRVETSERIYMAKMSFEPIIGKNYYLYSTHEGKDILSLISTEEWGNNFPFLEFINEVKLLSDHTWKIIRGNSF